VAAARARPFDRDQNIAELVPDDRYRVLKEARD